MSLGFYVFRVRMFVNPVSSVGRACISCEPAMRCPEFWVIN